MPNVATPSPTGGAGGPIPDEEYLDLVADWALATRSDGAEFDLASVVAERPHLAARIREVVALTAEIAVRGAPRQVRIGGYEIEREIGHGGMGTVFLARQIGLGRRVALKVLPGTSRLSERTRHRFLAEAHALGKLGHPNVVVIHEVFQTPEACAFAMEWVEGSDLQSVIDVRKRGTEKDLSAIRSYLGGESTRDAIEESWPSFVARLGVGIARALAAAHRAGLLHRDVKPSNVLLRKDGTALLSDFGLVRDESSARATESGLFVGTLAYAAPEQLRGEAVDARSDVYSLGITLYHALGLELPFRGTTPQAISHRIEVGDAMPLRRLNRDIPGDFATIVGKAIDPDPARRYESADALADDLERLLRLEPIAARRPGTAARWFKLIRRNRRMFATGVLSAVVTALVAWIAIATWNERRDRPLRARDKIEQARRVLLDPDSRRRAYFVLGASSERPFPPHAVEVLKRALQAYDEAIALDVSNQEARAERDAVVAALAHQELRGASPRTRGLIAYLEGRTEAALAEWAQLRVDSPSDPLIDAFVGEWRLEVGQPGIAYPHLLRAHHAWPDAEFLRLDLAEAAIGLRDLEGAEDWIRNLSFRDFEGEVPRLLLLRLHSDLADARGDLDSAEFFYEKLVGRFGPSPNAEMSHAKRLVRLGRAWDAAELVVTKLQSGPLPPIWKHEIPRIVAAAVGTLSRDALARIAISLIRGSPDPRATKLDVIFAHYRQFEDCATLPEFDSASGPQGVSLRDFVRVWKVLTMHRKQPVVVQSVFILETVHEESRIVGRLLAIGLMVPKSMLWSTIGLFVLSVAPRSHAQTELYRWNGDVPGAAFAVCDFAGDVDGDGFGDVVIGAHHDGAASSQNGSASVRSGRTGALIHKWVGDAAGDQFGHSVTGLGDLNGDGYADVAVGTRGVALSTFPGYVRVFSGQTGLPLYTLTGSAPGDIFGYRVKNLGDLDNDGRSDFGVSASGDGSHNYVKIFSGASGGLLFQYHKTHLDTLGADMAGLGDINGDGYREFVLSNYHTNSNTGEVIVYSGQSGGVLYAISGAAPFDYFGITVANAGDVNGDGKDDLLVSSPYSDAAGADAGRLDVFSGVNGVHLMARNGEAPGDNFGIGIAIGDEDGDGRADFAVGAPLHDSTAPDSGRVYVLSSVTLNTIFTLDGEAASDQFGGSRAGGDVTGDGWIDLVVGASFSDAGGADAGTVYVYTTHSGVCSTTLPHYTVGTTPLDVLLVDRDGDGDLDIVSADSGAGTISVLTNDGVGGFAAAALSVALVTGDDPTSVTMKGTGLAVACPTTNRIRLLERSGNTWTYSGFFLTFPGNRPVDIVSADIDGSNGPNDDLVFALEGTVFGVGGGVATSIGGGQSMLPAPPSGFLSVRRVAVGDLDGDGDQDIVAGMTGTAFAAGPTANVLLYANNGVGSFSYAGALIGDGVPSGLVLRDIDGDGHTDLIVSVQNGPPFTGGNGVKVFKNAVSGPLSPARFTDLGLLAAGSLPGDVAAADLDADSLAGFISHEDVVVADTTGSGLKALRAFGTTNFASTQDLEANDTPVALAVADLDGDSVPDIVAANAACDCVSVTLTPLTALAQKFGTGCSGTGGKVPAISAVSSPTFGNPSFGVKLTNGRASSFVYFGISLDYLNAPFGGGCSLYLMPPVAFYTTFTNTAGQAQINFAIPNSVPPFVALNAYFQYFVNDPVGGYSGFAFSDALRIRLGN